MARRKYRVRATTCPSTLEVKFYGQYRAWLFWLDISDSWYDTPCGAKEDILRHKEYAEAKKLHAVEAKEFNNARTKI